MGQAFILIGMGFSFALIGLGDIWIALERHTRISQPIQWVCLTFFAAFVTAGVVRAIYEAFKHARR